MNDFIAIDWGSSNVRAYLIQGGLCVEKKTTKSGLIYRKDFQEVLSEIVSEWDKFPLLICGMLGSKNGWRETKYVSSLHEIPNNLVDMSDLIGRKAWLIPGLSYFHTFQDVMRGEETQLFALDWNGLVIMPGTHCKWVWMQQDTLLQFHTKMTGELFGLLKEKGLLCSLLDQDTRKAEFSLHDFAAGVKESQAMSGLLHSLFSVRARGVHGATDGLHDYLSGLLIGTEISSQDSIESTLIIGNRELFTRYEYAFSLLRPETSLFFENEEDAIIRGLKNIWRKIDERN